MKKYIYYIFSLLFLTISACTGMEEFDETIPGDDAVIFSLRTTSGVVTRSEDTSVEEKMAKIDVFFVTEGGSVYYHEQVLNEEADPVYKQGEFTLIKRRSEFTANAKYYVYVIANAKADISNVQSLDALQTLTQEDDDLHLSGLVDGAPSLFLMDGFANITGAQSASPVAVVINDGVAQNKTYLTGVLRRAAAKIILNITQGDNVEFKERIPTEGVLLGEALYSFYQLPVSTLVLTPDGSSWHNSTKVTTDDQRINGKTFTWTYVDGKPHIQIIGYAYANDWGDTEITKETSMLLNIPMLWDHDNDDSTDPESRPNSWFKVPLSKENKFERNTCYQINIRINAVGAQDKSSVIELQDIEYVTQEWILHTVTVGQNDSNPEYLMLNTDLVQIYNENVDATSLTFSSSSYIKSITLKDVYKQNSDGSFTKDTDSHKAYYINKFGVMTELSDAVQAMITATPEPNVLNGAIEIFSPILQLTDEERDAALAALGPAPENPGEPPIEKPDPNDFVLQNTNNTEYRYRNGVFQKRTKKNNGSWNSWQTDNDATAKYNEALRQYEAAVQEYINNNPDYAERQAAYDRYQAAYQAVMAATTSGDTHYNTIRYLEFEVENLTGQKATFRVMQYPTIYITNQQCWFSYRDDFGGTTYLNRGANGIICATYNNEWGYSTSYDASNNFFASKVVSDFNEDNGKSVLSYYEWDGNSIDLPDESGNTNAHYYHIHVTATSDKYTVAIPQKDPTTGYVKNTVDNEKLVSPSFMIASQLGAVWSGKPGYDRDDAAYHCSQYVEVYKLASYEEGALTATLNGTTVYYKELRDWRLPTAAEIDIIVQHQTGAAMDVVLGGKYYYCAGETTRVDTGQNNQTTTTYTRCIRDAY